ncbi:hypothetical protein FGO68_gene6101 [Halteria grandinella]|uniref:Uncharacterized protein n=1 Tax=Halteria grandinella TaxID=5974 RepID=A0A8J8NGK8_HALGN|nr:hypothetical protein FGO68_gene6101 [Halteria grandinella]
MAIQLTGISRCMWKAFAVGIFYLDRHLLLTATNLNNRCIVGCLAKIVMRVAIFQHLTDDSQKAKSRSC